jgi:hypothetical protein
LAERLVLLLVLAAGRDFWRGSSLVTTAQFSSGLFGSSVPVCGGGVVFCCVSCWCALFVWWCSFRRVMYYCFFFLNDAAVLLPFIKKIRNEVYF